MTEWIFRTTVFGMDSKTVDFNGIWSNFTKTDKMTSELPF